jgi:hydrogenase maturation protein HypF
VRQMLERRFNTPPTSSAGRLFDAVACLAGVRDRVSYEGQAAMELEWLAGEATPDGTYSFDLAPVQVDNETAPAMEIDTRPLIRAVAHDAGTGIAAAVIARRFHSTLVRMIVAVCERLRLETRLNVVVLSGGVFMNALLSCEVSAHLREADFLVHRQRLVPPNDGGLSLGQLAVAAARGEE